MTAAPALSSEAAMVLGLAGTAMPFARSQAEEAERWLRVLRLHGDVSASLQAVGIGEAPVTDTEGPERSPSGEAGAPAPQAGGGGAPADAGQAVISSITELATRSAQRRGASAVGTVDVLIGAMDFYGKSFDQVLRAYGTDRDEVLERALEGAETAPPAGRK
jgi:hypothetical protein